VLQTHQKTGHHDFHINPLIRFAMGLRMTETQNYALDAGMRSRNTPHASELSTQKPKVGSFSNLFKSFWGSEAADKKQKSGHKTSEPEGTCGSILFDIDFSYSDSISKRSSITTAENLAKPANSDQQPEDKHESESRLSNADTESEEEGWMKLSQRPTTTQPVPIPKPHHSHTFERIEAIYI
jgi:hypothetical protein